ncbi:MAG: MarR family winged helix-turn-helix transcriptional regulator, partial [Pseudoalteromonas sp.]
MQKYDELLVSLRKVIRAIDLHSKQLNKTSGLTGPQLLIMQ